MCYSDVQTNNANKIYDLLTMQTKFARFRQKSSGIKLDPPKISRNRRAYVVRAADNEAIN